jgi:leucyl aminopeptidase
VPSASSIERTPRPKIRLVPLPVPDRPAVAVGVRAVDGAARPLPEAVSVVERLGLDLLALLERESATGAAGEVISIPVTSAGVNVRRLHLVGLGDASPPALREAAAALVRRADADADKAADVLAVRLGDRAEDLPVLAEALQLAAYRFRLGEEHRPPALDRIDLVVDRPDRQQSDLDRALAVSRAVWLARDLTNTCSATKSPQWLAEQAVASATTERRLTSRIRVEGELARDGFGGVVAVGKGSVRPPRLIELTYRPTRPARPRRRVVLVGKGITFDSGGLSLKRTDAIAAMKTDMAGGGAVVAVMTALAELDVRADVVALVPAAENLPSGTAQRPGDVIRHYGGRTAEVLNTDAEGRLVLADALAYADRVLRPDVVIDLATLTGAATIGLGRRHGALYSTDEDLATALVRAADEAGEGLWRMPLVEDYRRALDSPVADLANVNRNPHIQGGSITAALFLREFAGARRWAHLDIAGPARADGDEREVTKGATGYGVRLLLRWLTAT